MPHAAIQPLFDGATIALSTDLYEVTMAASYLRLGMRDAAGFSLFSRKLPRCRRYLVAAGVEEALDRLELARFDPDAVEYVLSTGRIRPSEAQALADFRFSGDVWAAREGRFVFADEPILEVRAPIGEAQLVETTLLNAIHFESVVASKAARCVAAARGRPVVDFGLRRTAGIEAGLTVARASFLAGFASTSNVLAGRRLGIPVSGTVAHSFIETFEDEREAFRAMARTSSGQVTFLVDTFDTLRGTAHAIEVAHELGGQRAPVAAVRLDSGDLDALSREVRRMLDDARLERIRIFASGGLDEYAVDALVRAGAPIDAFGVGTRIGMSADAPILDMAYKIVEYAGRPCLKLSEGKATLACLKQVWRRLGPDGQCAEDRICLREEPAPGPDWEPLLEPVFVRGERRRRPSLSELRSAHAQECARFRALADLHSDATYPVRLSSALEARQREAVEGILARSP
jgi:nicotinate phosphoribosyltransferase